jgi:hypothetical protein
MHQDQQRRPWWKDNWPVLASVALAIVIATITGLGYWLRWTWTGLETKSAWDWLELLIIPVALGAGAFWFNTQTRKSERELAHRERENEQELAHRERENDREIAQDRVREEVLQRYLDRMQELILDEGLRRPEKGAEIRSVSRARMLTALRSLDGNRKGQVVWFLYEAGLIGKGESDSPFAQPGEQYAEGLSNRALSSMGRGLRWGKEHTLRKNQVISSVEPAYTHR